MNKNKLIATVGLAVVVIATMTSNQLSIYASPTTEDDGWTEGDYEGSLEEQEEQAEEDWEDAGRPGDDDNGDDGEQIFTCSNGSTVTGDEECPPTGPNPYCDKVPDNDQDTCHDRKDYYDGGPKNGLYPCNDGTAKTDWRDCKDATENNNDNDNGGSDKTIVVDKPQKTLTLSIESCKDIGTSDGKELKFNAEIYKRCNDTYHNDDIGSGLSTRENTYYYFDFISGCEQAGWSTHDCVKAVKVN